MKINYLDLISKINNPYIVQIGAHDGVLGEEYGLQEYLCKLQNFQLFLIEPIEKYFKNLYSVYSKFGDKVKYYNYAITDNDGYTTMQDNGGMSHISKDGNLSVKTKNWKSFVEESCIENIDLLLLDCEGYEYNILKNLDYIKNRPKIIRYEYYWIDDKIGCDNFLTHHGYNIAFCEHDTIYNKVAYDKSSITL